jgi:putative DNA primase/helicase
MDTVEAARGRWFGILTHFGIDGKYLQKKHGPCPNCGGKDRFIWDNKEDRGTFYCNQCGAGSGFTLLSKVKGWTTVETMHKVREILGTVERRVNDKPEVTDQQKREALNKTWKASQPISEGDPVWLYLKSRTGHQWASNALRYHAELWHPEEKQTFPAMVAKVADLDNKPVSIHRTFLDLSGNKAQISKTKMIMSSTIPDGAAIRLMPYQHVIGVAEGIETALSAHVIFGIPVWATISASIMAKWTPPSGVERVVIFADNDRNFVGQLAAYRLGWNLVKTGLDVVVATPNVTGADWNDIIKLGDLATVRHESYISHPKAFRLKPD